MAVYRNLIKAEGKSLAKTAEIRKRGTSKKRDNLTDIQRKKKMMRLKRRGKK